MSDVEFYIGPYLDADCLDSFLKHKDIIAYPDDELNFIQDDTTASSVLAKKIAYHSDSKARIQFQTFLNAVDCELRDLCYVDHDFLPQETRKRISGSAISASAGIDASVTSVAVTLGTDFSVDDVIIVEDEVMKVTAISTNTLTCTRNFAGSLAATHADDTPIYKLTTKWEILSISINPQQVNMYTLSLREV